MRAVSCSSSTSCVAVGTAASKPFAETWNGTSWSTSAPPNVSGSLLTTLVGVSCTSSTACTAVGLSWVSSPQSLAERWNGTSWSIQSVPSLGGSLGSALEGVSCSSSTSCIAVGFNVNAPSEDRTLAEKWNGTTWTAESPPNVSGAKEDALAAVSCTSSTACTAVGKALPGAEKGQNSIPVADGWSGSSWSAQSPLTVPPLTEDKMSGVSCPSSSRCLAVGRNVAAEESFLELWNGSEWKFTNSAIAGEVKKISCPSTTYCIAVGASSGGGLSYWKATESGGTWTLSSGTPPTPSGGSSPILKDVACSAESACTAVGAYKAESTWKPLVERWNGTSWSVQSAPNPSEGTAEEAMRAVSCSSSTSCVAVGTAASKPFAETWNGTSWSISAPPNPTGATAVSLKGVSCPSSSSCVLVGHYTVGGGYAKGLAEIWNGMTWSLMVVPTPAESEGGSELLGISCLSPRSCVAVGGRYNKVDSGELHLPSEERPLTDSWNGTEWTVQSNPPIASMTWGALSSVSCTTAIDCTATGNANPVTQKGESLTLGERFE